LQVGWPGLLSHRQDCSAAKSPEISGVKDRRDGQLFEMVDAGDRLGFLLALLSAGNNIEAE
jgi:hypothetical protein